MCVCGFLLCFASLLLFFFSVSNHLFSWKLRLPSLIYFCFVVSFSNSDNLVMWLTASERSNVSFFLLFYFSFFFISLKSGKCFIDHCLPVLFLWVYFASPRKFLISLSLLPRLDPFLIQSSGLFLGWKKIKKNESKEWWSWVSVVALLLGISFFFRPASSISVFVRVHLSWIVVLNQVLCSLFSFCFIRTRMQ